MKRKSKTNKDSNKKQKSITKYFSLTKQQDNNNNVNNCNIQQDDHNSNNVNNNNTQQDYNNNTNINDNQQDNSNININNNQQYNNNIFISNPNISTSSTNNDSNEDNIYYKITNQKIQKIITIIKTYGFHYDREQIKSIKLNQKQVEHIGNEIIEKLKEITDVESIVHRQTYVPTTFNIPKNHTLHTRIMNISSDLIRNININEDVNKYNQIKQNELNLNEKEYLIIKSYKEFGCENFTQIKNKLKEFGIKEEEINKNTIIQILNKLNKKYEIEKNYDKPLIKDGKTTIINSINIFKKKKEIIERLNNIIYINNLLINLYTRLLHYNIMLSIENNNYNNELINNNTTDFHYHNLTKLMYYLYNGNQSIKQKMIIPEQFQFPHFPIQQQTDCTILSQTLKYDSEIIKSNIDIHLSLTIKEYLKKITHLKIDYLNVNKKERSYVINRVLNEVYKEENDEDDDEYQDHQKYVQNDNINVSEEQINQIVSSIKDLFDMNNNFPLSKEKIRNLNLNYNIYTFYHNINQQMISCNKKSIKLLPLSRLTRYITLDKVSTNVLHSYAPHHYFKLDEHINLQKLNLSNKMKMMYIPKTIKTNGKEVLITFQKYKEKEEQPKENINQNNKNNKNKNNNQKSDKINKKHRKQLDNSAGIDPGVKLIGVTKTDDGKVIKLSQKEYYNRSNLNELRENINQLKKKNNINEYEKNISFKKNNTQLIIQSLNHYSNNYQTLHKFYKKSSILNLKYKTKIRKKSVISDYIQTVKRTLLFKERCKKSNERYSLRKSSPNYAKNRKERRTKNKLVDSNNSKERKSNIMVFYGSSGWKKSFRNNQSTPQSSIYNECKNNIPTKLTSEFNTTKLCSECHQILDDREDRVACCKNMNCNFSYLPVNRDISAASNILKNGKHFYYNDEYHPKFRRY